MKGKKVEKVWDKISLTGWNCSNLNAPSTETPVSHPLLRESLFPIFSPCLFSKYPRADGQTGTGPASQWAAIDLGRYGIGMLTGRPKIRRFTTKCRQLCDDYIPGLLLKRNYFIGTPTMKDKKLEIFWDKISLTICKWSNLNAQTSETPRCHTLSGTGTTVEMLRALATTAPSLLRPRPEITSLVNGASKDG